MLRREGLSGLFGEWRSVDSSGVAACLGNGMVRVRICRARNSFSGARFRPGRLPRAAPCAAGGGRVRVKIWVLFRVAAAPNVGVHVTLACRSLPVSGFLFSSFQAPSIPVAALFSFLSHYSRIRSNLTLRGLDLDFALRVSSVQQSRLEGGHHLEYSTWCTRLEEFLAAPTSSSKDPRSRVREERSVL
jgi:hypothetical protein